MSDDSKKATIKVKVKPELDGGSVAKMMKDLNRSFAPVSARAIKEIDGMSTVLKHFGKELTSSTKSAVKELEHLGKELKEAEDAANDLRMSSKSGGDKAKINMQLSQMTNRIANANKAITDFRRSNISAGREIRNLTTKYHTYQNKMTSRAGRDTHGEIMSGMKTMAHGGIRAGASQLKSAIKGHAEKRIAEKHIDSMAAGDEAGMRMAAGMDAALGAAGVLGIGLVALTKLIIAASDHMTGLNKAVFNGGGLINNYGSSAGDLSSSLKNIRNAAIDSTGALIRYGVNSEDAMKAVGAFTNEASGSIIKTEQQLTSMGKGHLSDGLKEFAKNASVYGKALGVSTEETATLMGQMVSEFGLSADNVQQTLGDVVKQAGQAGMPVNKFMDIFHSVLPNVDLFTNRLEELTGVMKMLSKTMDPRAVKSFMSVMTKGFDQLDFKQRLRLNLTAGVGNVDKLQKGDIKRDTSLVSDQLKNVGLSDAFEQAMKSKDTQKAVAEVAVRAIQAGVSGATVGKMQDVARYKELNAGDTLDKTTAMSNSSLFTRMKTLELSARRFAPGNKITGLGEQVASHSVSHDEYGALVALEKNMLVYTTSVKNWGRTNSKSINDNLKKILKYDKKFGESDEDAFERTMKELATHDPSKLEDSIKLAATQQIEEVSAQAEDDKKRVATTDDLVAEQIDATLSISSKITNVIEYFLEKIFQGIDSIFGAVTDIYNGLPGWITGGNKDAVRGLGAEFKTATNEFGKDNKGGLKYFDDVNKRLLGSLGRDDKSADMYAENKDLVNSGLMANASDPEIQKLLQEISPTGTASGNELRKDMKEGNTEDIGKHLSAVDPEKMARLISALAKRKALGMKDGDPYADMKRDDAERRKGMTQKELQARKNDEKTADHDKRLDEKMGMPVAAAGAAVATAAGAAVADALPASFDVGGAGGSNWGDGAEIGGSGGSVWDGISKGQDEANKIATDHAKTSSDISDHLDKGVKFEKSWMDNKYKNVLKDGTLDAFRPALQEYLLAYLKLTNDKGMLDEYLKSGGTGGSSLATINQFQSAEEMRQANEAQNAQHHARGGVASYTGLHVLSAGERVLPVGSSAPGGSGHNYNFSINVANGTVQNVKAAVLQVMDEVARRH